MSWWDILTAFGMGVMFLLTGIIILFLVSAVYHFMAGTRKTKEGRTGQTPPDVLSKAA